MYITMYIRSMIKIVKILKKDEVTFCKGYRNLNFKASFRWKMPLTTKCEHRFRESPKRKRSKVHDFAQSANTVRTPIPRAQSPMPLFWSLKSGSFKSFSVIQSEMITFAPSRSLVKKWWKNKTVRACILGRPRSRMKGWWKQTARLEPTRRKNLICESSYPANTMK